MCRQEVAASKVEAWLKPRRGDFEVEDVYAHDTKTRSVLDTFGLDVISESVGVIIWAVACTLRHNSRVVKHPL